MTATAQHFDRDAYIDLIKRSVANYHYLGGEASFEQFRCVTHHDNERGQWSVDQGARPLTLLSKKQMDFLEQAVLVLEERRVPGDYIEAGVWRGGVIILLRALINAYRISERKVFAADTLARIPRNGRTRDDAVDNGNGRWGASLAELKKNIERFGLLDDRIGFVVGRFDESLKSLTNEKFSLLRLDSDTYESIETSLEYLYPQLSSEGIIIVDDWRLPECRSAVRDYRLRHAITDEICECDGNAYWVKQ